MLNTKYESHHYGRGGGCKTRLVDPQLVCQEIPLGGFQELQPAVNLVTLHGPLPGLSFTLCHLHWDTGSVPVAGGTTVMTPSNNEQ